MSYMRGCLTQVLLVILALISVPIMLLPKPLVLQKRFKERAKQLEDYGRVSPHDEDEETGGNGALRMAAPAHEHEEEFDFSEVIVHQVCMTTVLHCARPPGPAPCVLKEEFALRSQISACCLSKGVQASAPLVLWRATRRGDDGENGVQCHWRTCPCRYEEMHQCYADDPHH